MDSEFVSVSKSVRRRNRILLSLFVPLALVSIATARAPERRTASASPSDFVVHADGGGERSRDTANPPIVQGLRYLIRNAFDTRKPGCSNAMCVRSALVPVLGAAMSETTYDMVYVWVLIDGSWVLVCNKRTEFTVEVDGLGRAIIETVDAEF